jgi:hypothetical protein
MKTKLTMKVLKLFSLPLFLIAHFSLLIVLSCEQPFKAGLGTVIDLQAPVIALASPGAGAYIRGVTEFTGRASDDYKIDSLWFQLSNYPDTELPKNEYTSYGEIKKREHKYGRFYKITDIVGDSRSCTWKFSIDTTLFPDGDFLIKLMAIDSVTKEAITDDIAFYVKNNIPQISMAFPSIVPGTKDGDIGGPHLNFNYIQNTPNSYPRVLDSKGLLVGMVSDTEGINRKTGQAEIMDDQGNAKTVELFPPQIRFWRVNVAGEDVSGVTTPVFPPGYLPTEAELKWEKLQLMEIGVNNVQFTYQLPSVSGQYFGFEIRAQSSDKVHSEANYPRSWVTSDTGSEGEKTPHENSYVLIFVREPTEYPILELYKLEDLFGPNGWDPAKGKDGGYNDITGLDKDGNYPYVDKAISGKGGAFTLRMKAFHSGGISTAEVYWEKDDKSEKGRFIWDPTNESPFPLWKGDRISGLLDFNRWGRNDPYIGSGSTTRSFVFTYSDLNESKNVPGPNDIIPNTGDFYTAIRGRSKIQVYKKTAPQHDENGRLLEFDELSKDMNDWQDIYKLDEGSYNLSVYTRSSSNTPIAVPFTATISIDRVEPDVDLNFIDGEAKNYTSTTAGAFVVNGVIRPRFLLSDSRPVDSGFRTATSDYFKRSDTGRFGYEQAYILIPAASKTTMDDYLKGHPWPQFPAATNGNLAIPGVTVSKHGPIVDSVCLFKTSKNYDTSVSEPDALADGIYWLYAFARDNAFNVGTTSFPIDVKFISDEPVFDFSVGSVNPDIDDPGYEYDLGGSKYKEPGTSFKTKDGIQNKFSASSGIRVRIADDDSLDLGVQGGAASRIEVEFVGMNTSTGDAYTDADHIMNLTDAQIKDAFTPQTADRKPVKELLGVISQNMLLERLKEKAANYPGLFGGDPAGYSSLPDGLYKVKITIYDYSPAKLVIEPADAANPARGPDSPKVKSKSESFWIAVDSKTPVNIIDEDKSKKANSFISASDSVNLWFKSVSDINGPITVTPAVYQGDGKTPVTGANPPTIKIRNNTPPVPITTSGEWVYNDYVFDINMNNNNGDFVFEVKFQDRFGNTSTVQRKYSVDSEPPTVSLTKKIYTFERNKDDVVLPNGGAISSVNKERLAVKVINFSINALDNFKVEDIRWWFLPANMQVTDFNAFPANQTNASDIGTYYSSGVYYNSSNASPSYSAITIPGFTAGAYGVVDVEKRKFTIFIDTERLAAKDGEYRLHIMARDNAGNVSSYLDPDINVPNVFQTVFLLQEEDKPYFDSISPNNPADSTKPKAVVGDSGLVVRGNLFENNGFFEDNGTDIRIDSVQIWFSKSGAASPAANDDLSALPAAWVGPKTVPITDLGRSGRNLSLAIKLKDVLNDINGSEIGNDGPKSYIIKATDSRVNKLRKDNGAAALNADTSIVRESRWKYYSFVYDANPPGVKITDPEPNQPFGNTSFGNDFILKGHIEDVNLAPLTYYYQNLPATNPDYNKTDNSYYFEYFVDTDAVRKPLKLDAANSSTIVTGATPPMIHVEFTIPASVVASTIIPNFASLKEGDHSLTIIATDLSGKETSVMYNFKKDDTPPSISLDIDEKWKSANDWWATNTADRLTWLTNSANRLPTIYYDGSSSSAKEKPVLTGTFSDDISDIKTSSIKYWIDGPISGTANTSADITIDGSGRNVRWSVNLTNNRLLDTGTPLPDGVHTIVLEVADTSNKTNVEHLMFAFRIDSRPPVATITGVTNAPADQTVFGKPSQQPDPVFTITGTASDANLEKMELRIVDKTAAAGAPPVITNTFNTTASNTTYTPFKTPPADPPLEDKVKLTWTQTIPKSLFNNNTLVDGKSYDVKVIAYDYKGNQSEEAVWTFTVDTKEPEISFTNPDLTNTVTPSRSPSDFINSNADPDPANNMLPGINNINRLSSENLRIQGKVKDNNAISALQSRVEKWNWSTGAWNQVQGWATIPGSIDANKRKEINWTKNLLGQDDPGESNRLDIRTTENPTGEGLYRIQIRAKDESYTQNGTKPADPVVNWNTATDIGNPIESPYLYFYYDRNVPELTVEGSMDNFYSTALFGGVFKFAGTVMDNNRFARVEVRLFLTTNTGDTLAKPMVKATLKNKSNGSTPTLDRGESVQDWSAEISATGCADGRYKIVVTAYDMAGKPYSITKAFTLDNTPPGARFTLPSKELTKYKGNGTDSESNSFASVIVNGGEGAVITGETWDKPPAGGQSGTESGIDQMWFRLGFIDGNGTTTPAFPTKANIKADEDRLIALAKALPGNSAKTLNELMDIVSEYRVTGTDTAGLGNSWFKLGGTSKPTGFVINNPNIYDWRMEIPATQGAIPPADAADYAATNVNGSPIIAGTQIGGLKLYGSPITVKGRQYTVGSGARQMVQTVQGQAGIYRLPLWIRLVDKVGNVEYYCHDIWIYPDGDIPTTTIFGADNGPKDKARGGAISVDGEARSNTSVYDVIFRVFADGAGSPTKQATDLDGTKAYVLPDAKDVVRMPSSLYEFVPIGSVLYNTIPTTYTTTDRYNGFGMIDPATSNSNWYRASLSLKGGAGEPLIPWSVIINAEQEITGLISSRGFISKAGGTTNDTIRVWLEVFVFNGEGAPIRSSIYQDDQLNTGGGGAWYGTAGNPKPYVKSFFIKSAAPQITHPDVGGWDGSKLVWNAPNQATADPTTPGYKGAGAETPRRDRLGVKAILDPFGRDGTGSDLAEVSIRTKLSNDPITTWTKVWENGAVIAGNPGIQITTRSVAATPTRTRYNFEYDIATKAAASGYALLNNGDWANSGGTLVVQVRIRDKASPPNEAEQTIVVGVDNFAPVADTAYVTNPKVAGTNVDFMGRVYDYATSPLLDTMQKDISPRKIAKVYAWFTRTESAGLRYVNINTGARAATPASGTRTMSVREGRAAVVTYGSNSDIINGINLTSQGTVNASRTLPSLGTQSAHNADWVREISESTATPGTRMLWSPVNSAVDDIRWSFNIDTTVLPDGKMTLHYIVEDSAGNASYYTQEVSVRNKYPQIDRVTLYTDNNGIGAVYTTHTGTNIASTEYTLNDYQNKMFANYTDPADYTAPNAAPVTPNTPNKLDSLGYLNSGFISKNQYIGFKVETSYGNRDLNFRLQYVTRQRVALNSTTLNDMVADRNSADPTKINLYTIAWHGDYSNAKWRALGVPVDNPVLGTHFVFNPPKDFSVAAAVGSAEVWKYTAVKTRTDVTPTGQPADDAVVFGGTDERRFEFNENNTAAEAKFTGIPELMGSHPDAGDSKPDDPKQTAFFLIRVWDTVNSASSDEYGIRYQDGTTDADATRKRERWANDQLFDALVVGMNVYLTDSTPPTVRLYDPNPYAETAVVGNNIGDANKEQTIRNALDPRGIGQNILRGGLYNVKTERELVKSGHIEPRSNLLPNNANFKGSALHPRVRNPVTKAYETLVADGFVAGDSETNTYNDGTNWVTVTRDMVSGKIILRGSSWDDQLIREIRVKIGTGTLSPTDDLFNPSSTAGKNLAILSLDLSGTPAGNPNYLTMQPANNAKAWAAEELHWKTGHTVEWAYVWDTENKPNTSGTPASDVKVWVAVIDNLGNNKAGLPSDNTVIPADPADAETTGIFKNSLSFDIVPYITGIERDAKFATKRSLQGWYSFFQGETNVSIVGYNLRGTAMANPAVRIQTGASTYTANPAITGTSTINKITFTVPNDAVSGKILLYTNTAVGGSAEALNHRSRDTQSWNKEYHPFTDGSTLWINKPYAHIWRTSDSDTAPRTYMGRKDISWNSGSAGLSHPGMALEYHNGTNNNPGRLHGTWQVYGYANVYYGTNNNSNINLVGTATPTEPWATPDISIYNGGALYNNTATTVANMGLAYQGDGNAILFFKGRAGAGNLADSNWNSHANAIQQSGSGSGNNGVPTQSWQNVRIAKADANTADNESNIGRIYMTAFNARFNSMWYGSRNGTSNTTMVIDGSPITSNTRVDLIDANNGIAAVASAGQFSAVDYDTTGPIVAYYDQTNDTLRIALGQNTTPTRAANQWNRKYVLASDHPLFRGSGRYVSIKVDKNNGIHLAFFNSVRNTVVYAYAASRSANFTAYAIDDVVKGGTWTDISVDNNGNPWIVYGDSTRTGNYDGVRMAYRSGTGNTTGIQFVRDKKDPVTGAVDIKGWEAVTMPANFQVNNDRLNIEAWPPTDRRTNPPALTGAPGWNAAIGYASDMFRIGYFFYPGYKDGNY